MNDILLRLGQSQVDAMFARQEEGPIIDDSQFIPLVEAVLAAFEEIDDAIAEALWDHAYAVYDQLCKEAVPESTAEENRELMQRYLLRGQRSQQSNKRELRIGVIAAIRGRLKLGKGAAFVKSRLRRLPQLDDTWEADIQPIGDSWLGMVFEQEHGAVPSHEFLDHRPSVNDLARLLADAMYRPLSEDRQHRPATVLLRTNPEWDELLPHLQELGIAVISADTLPTWIEAAREFTTSVDEGRLTK
jgi:hypothetical protein